MTEPNPNHLPGPNELFTAMKGQRGHLEELQRCIERHESRVIESQNELGKLRAVVADVKVDLKRLARDYAEALEAEL